jgi:glycosyltransferase involved in cell wall biosynthesis
VKKRKILVFAHVPPPHHGQSVMVQVLLEGLRADPCFEVHHVDARVSDDLEDVGSFRPAKFWRLFKCILQAWWIRLRYGRMAFYYVPAPAKRSAILRDWLVMALCRRLFPELILHWHAYGLGEWAAAGNDWQRRLTRLALGKADLSIVLNGYNRRDAEVFAPRRIEVVPNGIADLFPDYEQGLHARREARAIRLRQLGLRWDEEALETVRFLFLGHLIESKGVFVAIEATRLANEQLRKSNAPWRAELTLAGGFASEEEKVRVLAAIDEANQVAGGLRHKADGIRLEGGEALQREALTGRREVGEQGGAMIELVGFLASGKKKSALERADCLVFPTFYEGETQGLVLLEAMSAGLKVITTSWRGVLEVLPEGYAWVVAPGSADELARVMVAQLGDDRSVTLRQRYEKSYTLAKHVEVLTGKLFGLPEQNKAPRN